MHSCTSSDRAEAGVSALNMKTNITKTKKTQQDIMVTFFFNSGDPNYRDLYLTNYYVLDIRPLSDPTAIGLITPNRRKKNYPVNTINKRWEVSVFINYKYKLLIEAEAVINTETPNLSDS